MRWMSRAVLCLAAALPAGCAGRPSAAEVLVGHVATSSGPDRAGGEAEVRGIRLAVRQTDGDAGRTVAVLHADAHGKPEAFEAEAVRLTAVNRVAALVGGTTTEEVERLDRGRELALAPVPVVGLSGLPTRALSNFVFLAGVSPVEEGRALARVAAGPRPAPAARAAGVLGALAGPPGAGPVSVPAALAADRAAPHVITLVDERREEFVQVADAFARALGDGPAPWRYGKDADFAALARRVRAEHPDAILVAGEAEAVRQLRRFLPELTFYFGGRPLAGAALRAQRETADGVYFVTPFVTDADAPRARQFIEQYRAAFQEEPDAAAALAYEAAVLLFEAVRQAEGPSPRSQLREKLADLKDFPGLFGPLSFGPDRVLRRPLFVVRLDHGRAVTVRRCDTPSEGASR
jgi:hypothetical protein